MEYSIIEISKRFLNFNTIFKALADAYDLIIKFQWLLFSEQNLFFTFTLDGIWLFNLELKECLNNLEEYNYFSINIYGHEFYYNKSYASANEKQLNMYSIDIEVEALANSSIKILYKEKTVEIKLSLTELIAFSKILNEFLNNLLLLVPFLKINSHIIISSNIECLIFNYENKAVLKLNEEDIDRVLNFNIDEISVSETALPFSKGLFDFNTKEEALYIYSDLLNTSFVLSFNEFNLLKAFLERKKFVLESAAIHK